MGLNQNKFKVRTQFIKISPGEIKAYVPVDKHMQNSFHMRGKLCVCSRQYYVTFNR